MQDIAARKKALQSRRIGIVIALLIAGIFIAGIVAVIRSGEEDNNQIGIKEDIDSTKESEELVIENLEE